jgi:hypothetical protein
VDATQDAVPLEDGQVPANSLGGDVEGIGKGIDLDPSCGTGTFENVLLAFLCVHGVSSLGFGW